MITKLTIKKDDIDRIVSDCKRAVPNEACGLVFGNGGMVETICSIENAENSPNTYLLDVREQFDAIKHARQRGEEMLGIYHSHGKSEPYPSETDKRLAYYPDVAYIIVSLMEEEPVIKAYNIVDGEVTGISLEII